MEQLLAMMDANPRTNIPCCGTCEDGIVKPDIVFFGEPLPAHFDEALEADIEEADLLLVIGSSMKVQPVSIIPDLIRPSIPQILINRERLDHHFDMELLGDADMILGELSQRLGLTLSPYDVDGLVEPSLEFVEPNITLFPGAKLGGRPLIPEPSLDGSLLAEAAVSPDPVVSSLVQQIFPKPE